jgi:hypothetical protein
MKTKHVLFLTSVSVLVLGLRILVAAPSIMMEAVAYQLGIDEGALVNNNEDESLTDSKIATSSSIHGTTATQHSHPLAALKQQTRAIFYNIFVAPSSPFSGNKIVREQLQQIVQARGHENSTIYYTVIGGQLSGDGSLCSDSSIPSHRCHLLGHHKQAQEVVTLQAMYEYCVAHPDHHVTYLHDKGSFHAKIGVDRSRRIGTKGALACLLGNDETHAAATINISTTSQCNVCADHFSTHPHSHVPGNIFAAQCHYISQLVPPNKYEQSRRNVCRFIHRHADTIAANPKVDTSFCPSSVAVVEGASGNNSSVVATGNNKLTYNGAADSDNIGYGFGRYSMERWVASHPLFHICIVFQNASKKTFHTGWEHWEPESLPHFKRRKRTSADERRNLMFLVHEYAHSYGILDTRFNPDYFCQTYFSKFTGVCPLVSKEVRAAWTAEYSNGTAGTTNTRII